MIAFFFRKKTFVHESSAKQSDSTHDKPIKKTKKEIKKTDLGFQEICLTLAAETLEPAASAYELENSSMVDEIQNKRRNCREDTIMLNLRLDPEKKFSGKCSFTNLNSYSFFGLGCLNL